MNERERESFLMNHARTYARTHARTHESRVNFWFIVFI